MAETRLPTDHNSGVPNSVVNEMSRIFEGAADQIVRALAVPLDTDVSGEQFRRARAANQLRQIDAIARRFALAVRPIAERAALDSYRLGLRQSIGQMREYGLADAGRQQAQRQSFDVVNTRSVEVAARDIVISMGNALDDLGKDAKRLLRKISTAEISDADVTRALARNLIKGTPREAVREVREMFRAPGDQESYRKLGNRIITVGKANLSVRAYAETLVRTRTREIVVAAKKETWLENDIRLAVITGRISKNFCTRYIGLIVSLDGSSKDWPSLSSLPSGGPPFHPRCSKGTRPFIPHLAKDEDLENAKRARAHVESVGFDSRENLIDGEQAAAKQRL